jgi:hypothetical protein
MSVVKILLIVLAVWVVLGVIGLIVKGLFWLFVIACVAFGVTAISSARRRGRITGR